MTGIFRNPDEKKVYRFILMIENRILKKKKFSAKICFNIAFFPPLLKTKNEHCDNGMSYKMASFLFQVFFKISMLNFGL